MLVILFMLAVDWANESNATRNTLVRNSVRKERALQGQRLDRRGIGENLD
jgi:hypothetical protein